jgi:hypothetical protein
MVVDLLVRSRSGRVDGVAKGAALEADVIRWFAAHAK